jgi:hypothetical protein
MLAGDEEIVFPDTATQITAPATDQPALEEPLAPAYHFIVNFNHR